MLKGEPWQFARRPSTSCLRELDVETSPQGLLWFNYGLNQK
jgi:hypothetical protein